MRIEAFLMHPEWTTIAEHARAIEAAGFDALASPEIANDPFIPLAFAALATKRVQLRTAIAVAFPRSPMVVANLGWDLQVNSRGRFVLGLGTQVKGHNERRFSVKWVSPAQRLREYVESLRAIWRTWETRTPLSYEGQHYQFTLMTPEFAPPPSGLPPIPVYIAAVREPMIRLAGRVCDGVRLHGFCTQRYLAEVAKPTLDAGLASAGRNPAQFEICGGGFIATGPNDDAVRQMADTFRYRIAFYGSTRTYLPVLSLHGWDDLGAQLHQLSKTGRWHDMAALITDDVLQAFTVMAPYDRLAPAVAQRFGGLTDSIELAFQPGTAPELMRDVLSDLRKIPARFTGSPTTWDA